MFKNLLSATIVSLSLLSVATASNDKIPFVEQFNGVHAVKGADPLYPSQPTDPVSEQQMRTKGNPTSKVESNSEFAGFLKRNREACDLIAQRREFDLDPFLMDIEDCLAHDEDCLARVSDVLLRFDRIEREIEDVIHATATVSAGVRDLSERNLSQLTLFNVIYQNCDANNVELDLLSKKMTVLERNFYDFFLRPVCKWEILPWDITLLIASRLDGASAKNFSLVCKAFANAVNLRSNLKVAPAIQDLNLIKVLSTKPKITNLCLHGCKQLKESTLIHVLRSYPRLRLLNLDRCSAVNFNVLNTISDNCKKIQSLSICSVDGSFTNDQLAAFLTCCQSLRSLDVTGNAQITSQEQVDVLKVLNPNLLITWGTDPNLLGQTNAAGNGITAGQALVGAAVIGVGMFVLWNLFKDERQDENQDEYQDEYDQDFDD